MSNILLVYPKKRLFNESTEGSRKKVLLRLEQKSVKWVTDLVAKFCRARELVLDT